MRRLHIKFLARDRRRCEFTIDPLGGALFAVHGGDRELQQAPVAVKEFQARVEAEAGCKLRAFRMDRGGDFTSKAFHGVLCL